MTTISPLANILKKGLYGDFEGRNEDSLIKIKEITNLLIIQIVQYNNTSSQIKDLNIDGLTMPESVFKVNFNKDSRILWSGPKNWFLISNKKDLIESIKKTFDQNDFAVTDLSHSRAIIELEGKHSKEILKKGCPFNINELKQNNSANSIFNGIAITIDMIKDNPDKIRLFALRSFGESLCHSICDASLELGYKVI
jgi:sarcosine oxidase subunit gamma